LIFTMADLEVWVYGLESGEPTDSLGFSLAIPERAKLVLDWRKTVSQN